MANNKINKINVLGTLYDIGGGSSGGLTGYSGSIGSMIGDNISTSAFVYGMLEDGTLTNTYGSSTKYILTIINISGYGGIAMGRDCEYQQIGSSTYYVVKPTAENWMIMTE